MVKALKRPTCKNGKNFQKGKYASRKKVGGDIPSNSYNNSNNSNNSNNNNNVVIGTYNMSFYGDKGFDFNYDHYKLGIPEFAFQRRVIKAYPNNPRKFWMNTNDQLIEFIKEKKPAMIGLQEMNDTINYIKLLENWKLRKEHGTEANKILNKFIDKFNTYGTNVYENLINKERNSIEIKEYIFYNVLHSFYNIRNAIDLKGKFKEEKDKREVSYTNENTHKRETKLIPVGYTIDLNDEKTREKIIEKLKQNGTQKIKDDLQLINQENNKNMK